MFINKYFLNHCTKTTLTEKLKQHKNTKNIVYLHFGALRFGTATATPTTTTGLPPPLPCRTSVSAIASGSSNKTHYYSYSLSELNPFQFQFPLQFSQQRYFNQDWKDQDNQLKRHIPISKVNKVPLSPLSRPLVASPTPRRARPLRRQQPQQLGRYCDIDTDSLPTLPPIWGFHKTSKKKEEDPGERPRSSSSSDHQHHLFKHTIHRLDLNPPSPSPSFPDPRFLDVLGSITQRAGATMDGLTHSPEVTSRPFLSLSLLKSPVEQQPSLHRAFSSTLGMVQKATHPFSASSAAGDGSGRGAANPTSDAQAQVRSGVFAGGADGSRYIMRYDDCNRQGKVQVVEAPHLLALDRDMHIVAGSKDREKHATSTKTETCIVPIQRAIEPSRPEEQQRQQQQQQQQQQHEEKKRTSKRGRSPVPDSSAARANAEVASNNPSNGSSSSAILEQIKKVEREVQELSTLIQRWNPSQDQCQGSDPFTLRSALRSAAMSLSGLSFDLGGAALQYLHLHPAAPRPVLAKKSTPPVGTGGGSTNLAAPAVAIAAAATTATTATASAAAPLAVVSGTRRRSSFPLAQVAPREVVEALLVNAKSTAGAMGTAPSPVQISEVAVEWCGSDRVLDPAQIYRLEFDGGAQGAAAVCAGAALLKDNATNAVLATAGVTFTGGTNNRAEYMGAMLGMWLAKQMGVRRLLLQGDSQLIVNQIQGINKAREMKIFADAAQSMAKSFPEIKIHHVLRDFNKDADRLCDALIGPVLASVQK